MLGGVRPATLRHRDHGRPVYHANPGATPKLGLAPEPIAGADPLDHPLRLSRIWDLPRALARTEALIQTDRSLRFYWLRLCQDAMRTCPSGT